MTDLLDALGRGEYEINTSQPTRQRCSGCTPVTRSPSTPIPNPVCLSSNPPCAPPPQHLTHHVRPPRRARPLTVVDRRMWHIRGTSGRPRSHEGPGVASRRPGVARSRRGRRATCPRRSTTFRCPACRLPVGDLARLPQDGGDADGRSGPECTPGCRSARPREGFDDAEQLLRPEGGSYGAAEVLAIFADHTQSR